MGNALVGRLLLSLRRQGVPIWTGATVERLESADGRVNGALVRDSAGVSRRVHARRGVVLATGGFGGGASARAQYLPAPDAGHSVMSPGNTGDGLALAAGAGAVVDHQDQRSGAFWMPTSILKAAGKPPVLFPHIILDRAKPGVIAVNALGQRFTNEGDSYHDFVSAMLRDAEADERLAGRPAWLVSDARSLRKYGLGLVHPRALTLAPFKRGGYLLEAATLDGLAQQMGVPADALSASVARFNALCATGEDTDFGKGTTALNRQNGDPLQQPNPCMAALEQGPFHAVAVWPATLATATGVRTDENAAALDADGRRIEGLYAIGNDMSSIMRGSYPGPGTTIGPAMVFGYRCAMHAAGKARP
jgi:succinate dehydrogenase/fumarate reductase flavoprotein subunit